MREVQHLSAQLEATLQDVLDDIHMFRACADDINVLYVAVSSCKQACKRSHPNGES